MIHQNKVKKEIDAVGLYCPEPVFRLKTALDEIKKGEVIELLADDPATEEDARRLIARRGDKILDVKKDGGILKLTVMKVK